MAKQNKEKKSEKKNAAENVAAEQAQAEQQTQINPASYALTKDEVKAIEDIMFKQVDGQSAPNIRASMIQNMLMEIAFLTGRAAGIEQVQEQMKSVFQAPEQAEAMQAAEEAETVEADVVEA